MTIKLARERLGTVAEVMSSVVCVIDDDANVGYVARTLGDLAVTGAPVVKGERVVGVVSQTDLLGVTDPSTPIAEVMTETVYAVRAEDPVLLAVRLMVEQHIHRVIVVDDQGRLQGIVTSMDVLETILERSTGVDELELVDLRSTDS
jgi:predicted transcriptional regulator